MTCRVICIEGTEGSGKTTQCALLTKYLQDHGHQVLATKEPGTPLSPITMQLRGLMLDQQYDDQLTLVSRELISQAIRSIHLEKVVAPAKLTHDFIVQDRGIMSGLAYGAACGNDMGWLTDMALKVCGFSVRSSKPLYNVYDKVIVLTGNASDGLARAKLSKQEFTSGDAIEAKGSTFMEKVAGNFKELMTEFPTVELNIDGKSIQQVHLEILGILGLIEKETHGDQK